jgi:hypothetical protein
MWGPHFRERERKRMYRFGIGTGPRTAYVYWAEGFPRPFLSFSFFPFLFFFLIYFITFANLIQFAPNQFVKFKATFQNSKKTSFQNKVRFLEKLYGLA